MIQTRIGVFGCSSKVQNSITADTTTKAIFHDMSSATTGFEYPQSARPLQAHAPLSLVQVPTVLFFRRRVRVRARGKYLGRRRLHDVDGGVALVSLAFLFRLLFVK
jgi:hypothetical protein